MKSRFLIKPYTHSLPTLPTLMNRKKQRVYAFRTHTPRRMMLSAQWFGGHKTGKIILPPCGRQYCRPQSA